MSADFPTEADVVDGWDIKEVPEVGRVLAKLAYFKWMVVWWAEEERCFQWQVQNRDTAVGGRSESAAAAKAAAVARAKPESTRRSQGGISGLEELLTLDPY